MGVEMGVPSHTRTFVGTAWATPQDYVSRRKHSELPGLQHSPPQTGYSSGMPIVSVALRINTDHEKVNLATANDYCASH
jgi:hypothetical protein